ncbi:flagellar hook-associated protein FlgL [Simkania negevensis]|uniref:Flagellar hook-associated protein FlgL n=1 Tax=Simkania negevensis TaxID=83561 RepID=A0ABS3AQR5_9BACT|nr:flagellar hook-associated protein FlgL [Simkania negevensis]
MGNIGRIGNNQLMNIILRNISSQLARQGELFDQISSNKRILKPSDDPVGTAQVMGFKDQLNRNEEFENVAIAGDVWTNLTSASLDDAISTWQRVNEIAISAADGTKNAQDLTAMAEELEQLLQHLVQTGNSTSGGRYLFAGNRTDTPAFQVKSDPNTGRISGVFYQGDSEVRRLQTRETNTLPLNIVGSNAGRPGASGSFIDTNTGANAFKTIIELRDKLLNNDVIGISNQGGALDDIKKVQNSFISAQVRIGGTQESLALDRERIIKENADIESFLAEIENADTAKLILELNNVQNVYEAALASGGRILQLGLLRYI